MTPSGLVYLDNSATTPVDPRIVDKMIPYFTESFGNPASENHAYGWKAKNAVDEARKNVADLISAEPKEIFFTSGATESNNWVFFGLVSFLRRNYPNDKIHIISSVTEHASVVEPLKLLEKTGVEVSWVSLNSFGQVTAEAVAQLIRPETKLISVMSGNNEYGSLNPIQAIANLSSEKGIYFHTDTTQTIGKVPISVREIPIHLMSFSVHKMHGPKGVGALYIRKSNPTVQIDPLLLGGGHENGLRSGTVNVPLVVGMGETCRIALTEGLLASNDTKKRAEKFWSQLKEIFPNAKLNGDPINRIPGHLSVTLPGFPHIKVLPKLGGVALSTASACSSGILGGSTILGILGLSSQAAEETYRLTLSRKTSDADIDEAVRVFKKISAS